MTQTAAEDRGMIACASSLCTETFPGRTATDTCNRKPVNSAIYLHVAVCRQCGQFARTCRSLELLRDGKEKVSLSVSRTQPSTSKRVLHRGIQRLGRARIRRFRPRVGHRNSPFRGWDYMIPYMIGKLAPNSSHLTRGSVKYVPGRSYFRAVLSQSGNKFVTSPPPPIVERVHPNILCASNKGGSRGPRGPSNFK